MSKASRVLLMDAIVAAVPEGVTVYSEPPEAVTAPAIVIAPRSPYRVRDTYCDWRTNLRVTLAVQRGAGQAAGLDWADDMLDLVLPAILSAHQTVILERVTDTGITRNAGAVDLLTTAIDMNMEAL